MKTGPDFLLDRFLPALLFLGLFLWSVYIVMVLFGIDNTPFPW